MEQCEFCKTDIPADATVCTGCGAHKAPHKSAINLISYFTILPGIVLAGLGWFKGGFGGWTTLIFGVVLMGFGGQKISLLTNDPARWIWYRKK